jgi:hypothetical protein
MAVNQTLKKQIKLGFAQKPTAELQALLAAHDESQWSEEAFAAAADVLEDRQLGIATEPLPLPEPVGDPSPILAQKPLWQRLVPLFIVLGIIALGFRIVTGYMQHRVWKKIHEIEQREGKPIQEILRDRDAARKQPSKP